MHRVLQKAKTIRAFQNRAGSSVIMPLEKQNTGKKRGGKIHRGKERRGGKRRRKKRQIRQRKEERWRDALVYGRRHLCKTSGEKQTFQTGVGGSNDLRFCRSEFNVCKPQPLRMKGSLTLT